MSRKYKINDQEKLYFVTFTVINWIDVFSRKEYRDTFLESVRFCQLNKGLEVYAYVIMTNHIHMVVGSGTGAKLQDIIRDLKKFTSTSIIKAIDENKLESRREWLLWMFERAGRKNPNNTKYQFWQQHNQPLVLDSKEKVLRCIDYVHQNPVKAGIVLQADEYYYRCAKNYIENKHETLIEVVLV